MSSTIDIYLADLVPDAQKRVLEAAGIASASEANWDVLPLTTLEFYNEEDE